LAHAPAPRRRLQAAVLHPEIVRDLVAGFIDDPWLRSLDLETLEKVPAEFIGRRLRRRASDVVWRVRTGEGGVEARPATCRACSTC
jgi:hypothetical protein